MRWLGIGGGGDDGDGILQIGWSGSNYVILSSIADVICI